LGIARLKGFGQALKRRAKEAVLPLAFLAVCFYFGWHARHGERGLIAHAQRTEEIAVARRDLALAEAARDTIERRVQGLRGDHVDRDQLDERGRALLNMVGRDEIVLPYPPGQRLY
jgi:cell division protein FtsB